ncbi:unnamed protein product [Adineta ricciae]|uniref:Uncharacterized protein n=1 Tax=Adineta ricciae TaxID=249248 RepID=A0A814Z686_ADIRI|nr:unnamed protein product [Adineta ricciae]CAF1488669.1 unnamed protein product [Adineta ricciae]
MQQSRFDSIPILESSGIGWNWNWNRMESVGIGIGIEWNRSGLGLESNGIGWDWDWNRMELVGIGIGIEWNRPRIGGNRIELCQNLLKPTEYGYDFNIITTLLCETVSKDL